MRTGILCIRIVGTKVLSETKSAYKTKTSRHTRKKEKKECLWKRGGVGTKVLSEAKRAYNPKTSRHTKEE